MQSPTFFDATCIFTTFPCRQKNISGIDYVEMNQYIVSGTQIMISHSFQNRVAKIFQNVFKNILSTRATFH